LESFGYNLKIKMEKLQEGFTPVAIQVSSVDTEEGVVNGVVQDLGVKISFPVTTARLGVLLTGMEEDGGYLKAIVNTDGPVLALSNFQAVPNVGVFHLHLGPRNHRHRH